MKKNKERTGMRACICLFLSILILVVSGLFFSASVSAEEERVVRISCGINGLLDYDEDGNVSGYCKEYFDKLEEINHWKCEYVKADWNSAMKMLESGEIDILLPTTKTKEREKTMDFPTIIGGYTAPGLFVRGDSHFNYGDYQGFDGARIAVTKSSSNCQALRDFAREQGFSYEEVFIDSKEDKIAALKAGEVDMVIFSAVNEVPDAKLAAVLDAYPFYYAVKKGNKELLSELNSGMQQIMINCPELVGDTFKNSITGSNNEMFALTIEERMLVNNQTKIKVGFYEDTEPLAYVEKDGTYSGIYVEIMERLKEQSKLDIVLFPISREDNWRDLLREGVIDFYVGASETISESDDSFSVTNSLMDYKTVLVTKRGFSIHTEKDAVLVLTRARSYWVDRLPKQYQDAEVIYCKTAKDCLEAVKYGDADMTILNTIEFNYQTKNPRFESLMQWESYQFDSGACMVADREMNPAVISIINKSLASIPESEINDIKNRHLNMSYQNSDVLDRLYPAREVLFGLVMLILLGTITVVVVYRMKKRQNAIERKSRESERRQLRILAALSLDYAAVYYVNLTRDYYTTIKTEEGRQDEFAAAGYGDGAFSETIRRYIQKFVQEEYRDNMLSQTTETAVWERLAEDEAFALRYRVVPNEWKQDHFEMHFVRVASDKEDHIMVLGFRCVDVIAAEEIEQKSLLEDALEAANRANHAKSDFLSRMSHDMRTPMNGILGMSAIAASHMDDRERLEDALTKIQSSGRHLLGLINEVLDMSKVESGKIDLTEEEFRFSELINNLLIMVQPQIKEHKHNLQVHIVDIEHEDVRGDSLRIQQMFVNFMSNAIKYTPKGGNICLTVREKDLHKRHFGCYEFVFEDNGIGMSKDYLGHIFEPFSRAEDERTSKIQGAGLGMAIAMNIVRMMNGDISVESEEGKGSRFTVTIFLRLQEGKEPVPDESENDAAIGDYRGKRVLLVEDNELNQEIATEILKSAHLDVDEAGNGREAVDKFMASEPGYYDLIFMDVQMPIMNGHEAASAIRSLERPDAKQIPIVAMTANAFAEDVKAARAAGMNEHLAKPLDIKKLDDVLEKFLGASPGTNSL